MHYSIHDTGQLDPIDQVLIEILRQYPHGISAKELLAGLTGRGHDISLSTLSRRLTQLESRRHVIAHRAGRNTVYSRDPYHDWFLLPPTSRPKVPYKFEVLADYEPNQTRWLTADETARLTQAGGGRRLDASTYSRAIAQKLLVDLSYASSALEGNTYTYLDTQVLIEFGQAASGKAIEETQMILNHKEAIIYLTENIADIEISSRELRTLHALLSRGLMEPAAVGDIRKRIVEIGGSSYVPLSVPQKLEEELAAIASKARAIEEPFEQSLFLMAFVSYLQAFQDVNKRTGRLACNIPLLKNSLAPLSFMEMDKAGYVEGLLAFYELNRIDLLKETYVEAYVASSARYDAYLGRDRAVVELEFRRRADIYSGVKAYVEKSVAAGRPLDIETFGKEFFSTDPSDTRAKLIERVKEIVVSLNDANHIAYGILRKTFSNYERLRSGKR